MTDDFDIDELRKKLHSNLVLVEKQIGSYSSKFKRKLTNYLKENDRLLNSAFPVLKNVTYKIQNAISDDLNNILIMLTKSLYSMNPAMLRNYILKNELKVDKKSMENLDLLEEEIVSYIKGNGDISKIDIIKKLFDSYRESINFSVRSLNKKMNDISFLDIFEAIEGKETFIETTHLVDKVFDPTLNLHHTEDIIMNHEAVTSCAVIGVPDPTKGEIVKAFVTLKEGKNAMLAKVSIQKYLKKHLAKYEQPREIEVLDELPKTKLGKIAYKELEEYNKRA